TERSATRCAAKHAGASAARESTRIVFFAFMSGLQLGQSPGNASPFRAFRAGGCWGLLDQGRRALRRTMKPTSARPASSIAHSEGSGTGVTGPKLAAGREIWFTLPPSGELIVFSLLMAL